MPLRLLRSSCVPMTSHPASSHCAASCVRRVEKADGGEKKKRMSVEVLLEVEKDVEALGELGVSSKLHISKIRGRLKVLANTALP